MEDPMTLSLVPGEIRKGTEVGEAIESSTYRVNVSGAGDCFFLALWICLLINGSYKTKKFLGSFIDDGKLSIYAWRKWVAFQTAQGATQLGRGIVFTEKQWDEMLGICFSELKFNDIVNALKVPGKEIMEDYMLTAVLNSISRLFDCQFVISGYPGGALSCYAPIVFDNCRGQRTVPVIVLDYESNGKSGHFSLRIPITCKQDTILKDLLAAPFDSFGKIKEEYTGLEGTARYYTHLAEVHRYTTTTEYPVCGIKRTVDALFEL